MSLAPVALFTYNRLLHTKKTIEALQKNRLASETELIIFSDAAKNEQSVQEVKAIREFLTSVSGFLKVSIIEREFNYGLGRNIIEGVTEVLSRYGEVIVLEDDLLTSPYFLEYMNTALQLYQNEESVISIHGYLYPVNEELPETFFLKGADCWGWATWKRGWELFETDGKKLLQRLQENNLLHSFDYLGAYPYTQMLKDQIAGRNTSWAVRWYASAFIHDKYTLYPGRSLVYHAGGDGSGTNTGFDNLLDVNLTEKPVNVKRSTVQQNAQAYKVFREFYRKLSKPSLIYRLKRKIKKILG